MLLMVLQKPPGPFYRAIALNLCSGKYCSLAKQIKPGKSYSETIYLYIFFFFFSQSSMQINTNSSSQLNVITPCPVQMKTIKTNALSHAILL